MMALVPPSVSLTAPPPVCVARPASAHARAQRQRFNPPSAEGSGHYALAEDGRRAVCKRAGYYWTALGGVLGVGEAIRLKCVEKGSFASVGVAPRDAQQAEWMIGLQQGSVGVHSNGVLAVDRSIKRSDLPTWGAGSVIELKRVSEGVYSWSKGGEEIARHEAVGEVVWGVGGSDGTTWEVVEEVRTAWRAARLRGDGASDDALVIAPLIGTALLTAL